MANETFVERSAEEVAAEAYAEMDAEKGIITDPKIDGATPKKDDAKDGEPGDKTDEQGDDTKKTDAGDDADKKKAGEESEEEAPGSGDDALDDKGQDKKTVEHAEKHGLTYAEAKEDLEKTEAIIKQYKNDPSEMARAMRNKDREYQKLKTEAEKLKKPKEPLFERKADDNFRAWATEKIKEEPAKIQAYRDKFPHKTANMSDEAVTEELVEIGLANYHKIADQEESKIKDLAAQKRDELIRTVPEKDRRFIPTVKALLQEASDRDVLQDEMDIQDALYFAKGQHYDADIKAAEERALKRLKEAPEIIGTKNGGSSNTVKKTSTLNSAQKDRAREMFGADYEDEKCYEMFRDSYKDELAKNPNFDPYKD